MSYALEFDPAARRQLQKLAPLVRQRAALALAKLVQDPRPPGSLKLTNQNLWRVRFGEQRIKYLIDDSSKVVRVIWIGKRDDAY